MSLGDLMLVCVLLAAGVFAAWLNDRLQKAAELRAIRERSGSKVKAVDRLRYVIAADRAAVPCGRWVRRIRPLVETQFLAGLAMTAIKYPYLRTPAYRREMKPRWRLEWRR